MDKKGTQRIIGIMVIVALAIVVFPLLFGKNEITTAQKTNIEAPPFPDHAAPIADAEPAKQDAAVYTNANEPLAAAPNTTPDATLPTSTQVVPVVTTTATSAAPITEGNAAISKEIKPNVDSIAAQEPSTSSEKIHPPVTSLLDSNKATPSKAKKAIVAKTKPKPAHTTQKDLVKLQNVAWAVQMGSFKNKNNAVRLTDKLRVAGFKAFTREVKSAHGHSQIRVYIGPEFKMANAVKLSSKVQSEMKLSGIVVVYKPLSL